MNLKMIDLAQQEIGVSEIPGEENSVRIMQYARELKMAWYKNDEIPWCSLLVNWLAFKTGYERTNSLAARSWLNVGVETKTPELGDIVVFRRGKNPKAGHVALFVNFHGKHVRVIGGNQGDRVSYASFPVSDVLKFIQLNQQNETV